MNAKLAITAAIRRRRPEVIATCGRPPPRGGGGGRMGPRSAPNGGFYSGGEFAVGSRNSRRARPPTGEGALVGVGAMERAAAACRQGVFSGVVTGPVSKEWLARSLPCPSRRNSSRTAGLATGVGFGVASARRDRDGHVPLHQVGRLLGPHLLHRTVAAADTLCRSEGITAPRIGVCGLNPHAGEGGLLGYEERDFLNPALDHLRAEFPGLSRCEPGDTLFARQLRGEFDVVIALYHDQGLAR